MWKTLRPLREIAKWDQVGTKWDRKALSGTCSGVSLALKMQGEKATQTLKCLQWIAGFGDVFSTYGSILYCKV